MNTDLALLPRADLPVIWDAFKAKAEPLRETAETLVVTNVSQKEEMALARKTRLTLKEIRIAVEHKRVELGEGHLKEIQKVNGAAKAIREFIEPLEARLLVQESFAERAEALRISALAEARFLEVEAIKPRAVWVPAALAAMSEIEYDGLVARLRAEKAELEEANRLRVEAEKQLAEVRAEAQKRAIELQLELKAESDRLKAEAEAARILAQQERDAAAWKVQQERIEADGRLAEARAEQEAKFAAEVKSHREEQIIAVSVQAEKDRIRDEQLAVLEAELAQERAVKQAEADAARKLALAPDVEKLRAFVAVLRDGVKGPACEFPQAKRVVEVARLGILSLAQKVEDFCDE